MVVDDMQVSEVHDMMNDIGYLGFISLETGMSGSKTCKWKELGDVLPG